MASGTGSAQLTQTSRDWAIAFAVSQERDLAFRIKVETSQMEMERAMMAKAELETRSAMDRQREQRIVEDLLDIERELFTTQGELAGVRRDADSTIMTLLAEARDLRCALPLPVKWLLPAFFEGICIYIP